MNISETVVAQAAYLFGTQLNRLQLLGGMDGLAYAFERDGQGYVLKVTPLPADRPEDLPRMREKCAFVDYLAENGVRVARPVRSLNGQWVEAVESPEGNYLASAARRAPGHHINGRNPAEANHALYQKWGQVTGQMHALAKRYPTWRHDPAGVEPPTVIMDWKEEHQSFLGWRQEEDIRAKWVQLGSQLEKLPQTRDSYGLIHNDLHPQNFLVDNGEITVIDFDVCSYHWFATDIGIALFFADWLGAPEAEPARRAYLTGFLHDFMEGYRRENDLDAAWIERLPLFLRHHQILLYTVFSNEWKNKPNRWQTDTLKSWRKSILNDLPVVDIFPG
jgi:Ser/Thr protein kinase RdoA (MazF antagonist)